MSVGGAPATGGSSGGDEGTSEDTNTEAPTRCRVLIIGAGVAGLSAANHLIKNNIHDLYIVEARNRIGGRVVAINIEGRQLELGANWIHGVLGNPVYEVALSHGLVPIVQATRPHTVLAATQDGVRLPFAVLQEMYDVYSVFFKRCEEYYLCRYLPPEGVASVGEHLRLERDLYLQRLPEHQRHQRLLVFNYLMTRETCITGSGDLDNVDLMEIGSYTELPGGNIQLPTGFSSILRPLTKDIPSDRILKGHAVKVVKWRTGVMAGSDGGEGSEGVQSESPAEHCDKRCQPLVDIVCENGKRFLAESVICTVSLGVLQHSAKTMFDPPLPDYKLDSMERVGFGVVNKIYLEYERPFLSPDLTELILLWEVVEPDMEMSDRWYRKIYSFIKLNETLLLGWVSGEEAKFMETLPFDTVADRCTLILRQFLADPLVPKPKRCICTSWWSQPFSRGSYSFLGVGSGQEDLNNLAQPLYASATAATPSVLFAGEHCHPSFYSTVHGAYLSGREAGQQVCTPPSRGGGHGNTNAQTAGQPGYETTPSAAELHKSPSLAHDLTLDVHGTADLSSWLHGISLT